MRKSDISLIFASVFAILLGIAGITGHVKHSFYMLYLVLFLITLSAIVKKNMPISTVGVLLSVPLTYLAAESVKNLPALTVLLVAFELGLIGMYIKMVWKNRNRIGQRMLFLGH
ncbi:hypothetical protein NF865_08960 [Thermococcus aggregans]|uniref:Uncharacterized protein n=1 Tax=Thermococcus aggregans TaxID=110163 RepID=A0A9E7MWX1_THEAG|nr:hypothetical protein [Thermococcus aggregans]USS40424.1 hypothetical protein NF865_08960 [Thermococcus aggregans]